MPVPLSADNACLCALIRFTCERACAQVRVDDYTVVLDAPFNGTRISRIGLYSFQQNLVWFDEVS